MKVARIFHKISVTINALILKICLVCLFFMVAIILAQVYYRYVLNTGIPWAEEIAKKLMIWMALLAAGIVYYKNDHVKMSLITDRIKSPAALRILKFTTMAISFSFFLLLISSGIDYAIFGLRFTSAVTGMKNFWGNLAIPVGGAILTFHCLSLFIQEVVSMKSGKDVSEIIASSPNLDFQGSKEQQI